MLSTAKYGISVPCDDLVRGLGVVVALAMEHETLECGVETTAVCGMSGGVDRDKGTYWGGRRCRSGSCRG